MYCNKSKSILIATESHIFIDNLKPKNESLMENLHYFKGRDGLVLAIKLYAFNKFLYLVFLNVSYILTKNKIKISPNCILTSIQTGRYFIILSINHKNYLACRDVVMRSKFLPWVSLSNVIQFSILFNDLYFSYLIYKILIFSRISQSI